MIALALFVFASVYAFTDEVHIVAADFQQDKKGTWTVNVALLHNDEGWDHYADVWRIVDAEGNLLGERVLLHPHENEQPFTRAATGVTISDMHSFVYIEAHDSVHGWSSNRLEIDMSQVQAGRLQVKASD